MTEKTTDIKKEEDEKTAEYYEFIKSSVADGSYYKDATNWYFLKYVTPFCERTILIFAAIISLVVLFYLTEIIKGTFPLVEEFPVTIKAKDQSLYFPNLVPIKSKTDKEITTVDEAIAKYLLSIYIKDREGYDYSRAEISDINKKFSRLRNTSSVNEYKQFQLFMSKDNSNSPIYQFGKNVVRQIEVKSVRFYKKPPKDFTAKARNFLYVKIPTEAEVRFTATTISTKEDVVKKESEDFVVKMSFSFSGANNKENKSLNFVVNSYQLYKVQK